MESESDITIGAGNRLEGLISQLGLVHGADGLFIGKRNGFPIGLKILNPGAEMILLIQIRYPVDAEKKPVGKLSYGGETDALIRDAKLEISVENKITWLTFSKAGDARRGASHC